MKTSHLLRAERRIASADGSGVLERWRWGRAALADPAITNPAGTLRRGRGIAEQLIAAARAKGLKLSEREIQRRLQLARTYPTEELTRQALATYGTWEALAEAGFPAPDSPTEPALVDTAGHITPEGAAWQQEGLDGDDGSVFPRVVRVAGADHDRDRATLGTLRTYLEGCERWTDAHLRRNQRMRLHLEELAEAAGGDWETRYGVAVELAESQRPSRRSAQADPASSVRGRQPASLTQMRVPCPILKQPDRSGGPEGVRVT